MVGRLQDIFGLGLPGGLYRESVQLRGAVVRLPGLRLQGLLCGETGCPAAGGNKKTRSQFAELR